MSGLVHDHLKEYAGLPVVDWPSPAEKRRPAAAAGEAAWRIAADTYDSEETWPEAFARFTAAVDLTQVRALVVGAWPEAYEEGPGPVVGALLAAREQLPALRALFIGDMTFEECEISWIVQGDLTPLLTGFPELEQFGVRGGNSLEFPAVRHEKLRELVVQSGGLGADVVRGIAASDFPALTDLDLWLGTSEYGGDATVADLDPFLTGTRLPALRRLALRNSDMQDAVAAAFATAPVVARLDEVDLSMGVLTDKGAAALLAGQPLTHLKSLDLHHNYIGEDLARQLREALEPAGVRIDLGSANAESYTEGDTGTVWRYVAVGE
ncbi:STM4015 family protein [Streptomyces sp. NPDC021020]|uniref:STM4015 family protein n=1 Tax=Streptomyces sp. NPDC021020 TaxID=3365109 RepID=UPI00379BF3FD